MPISKYHAGSLEQVVCNAITWVKRKTLVAGRLVFNRHCGLWILQSIIFQSEDILALNELDMNLAIRLIYSTCILPVH